MQWRTGRTSWTPPDYIDGLGVLDERREVRNLAFLAVAFDVPELRESAIAQNFHMFPILPGRCCRLQLLRVVPCRGARSGPSRWVRSRRARTPEAEQPS